MKKVNKDLNDFANAAYEERTTYGKKQAEEYKKLVKVGPVPKGYCKCSYRKNAKEVRANASSECVKEYLDYLKRTQRNNPSRTMLELHQMSISREVAKEYGLSWE